MNWYEFEEHLRGLHAGGWDRQDSIPGRNADGEMDRFIAHIRAEALREVSFSFIDWGVMHGHETGTEENEWSHRSAAWLQDEADRWEANVREGAA